MARSSFAIAACVLMLAASARSQSLNERYVTIPFQGDFESLFKMRLQLAEKDAPLQRILEQLRKDPKKFNIDPGALKQLDLDNPALRAMLQSMVDKHKNAGAMSADDLKKLKDQVKKIMQPPAKTPDPPAGPATGDEPPLAAKAGMPAPPVQAQPDLLDRLVRDFVDHADGSKVGDWLRESPAFQNGLRDLKTLANFDKTPSPWGLDKLPEHLRWSEKLDLRLADGLLGSMKNISLPDLPNLHAPRINVGRWGMPNVPLPRLGGGGAAGLGKALVWAVVLLTSLLILWNLARNVSWRVLSKAPPTVLGPWPVDPARIETRSQLIQAFDHLAMRELGPKAKSWNHRAVARQLAVPADQSTAAQEIARLYEQARYTTGNEQLSSTDQAAARRHLCQLAGVPAS